TTNRVLAAPSVRKAARENDVNLKDIEGTGPNGRVLAKDLQQFINQRQVRIETDQQVVEKMHVETGLTKEQPITGLRKVIYHNMQETVSKVALCTGMDEVNVSKLVNLRNE